MWKLQRFHIQTYWRINHFWNLSLSRLGTKLINAIWRLILICMVHEWPVIYAHYESITFILSLSILEGLEQFQQFLLTSNVKTYSDLPNSVGSIFLFVSLLVFFVLHTYKNNINNFYIVQITHLLLSSLVCSFSLY